MIRGLSGKTDKELDNEEIDNVRNGVDAVREQRLTMPEDAGEELADCEQSVKTQAEIDNLFGFTLAVLMFLLFGQSGVLRCFQG